jgi:hypothetical protein
MAVDIYFFYSYPPFGLEEEMDSDSQILSKTVVEVIPQKVLDINNHFWLTYSWHPRSFSSRSPVLSLAIAMADSCTTPVTMVSSGQRTRTRI